MGVNVSHFVVWGYKMPYLENAEENEEKWEFYDLPYNREQARGTVRLIQDGMGGKYAVMGLVFDTASEEYGFNHAVLPSQAEMMQEFGSHVVAGMQVIEQLPLIEPQWIIFTHYS